MNVDYNKLFNSLDSTIFKPEEVCCDNIYNFIYNNNDIIICKKCNNIITTITDTPEWKNYITNETSLNTNRCGMPSNILLPDSSHGSTINNKYNSNKTMNRVIQVQKWNGMTYKERSIYKVFNELIDSGKKHNLPTIIINESKSLYKIIAENKISRGANRRGLIAACIYFACKACGYPRSSKEVANIYNIKPNIMTKGIKQFQEILQLSNQKHRVYGAKSIKADDFIERFCDNLNISNNDIKNIKNITNKVYNININTENTPPSIAAGSIYAYVVKNNLNISKKTISDISRISEVTINKCSKLIEENLKI